jgi:hypothetical protein
VLHVTNGDVVARLLGEAGLPGTIVPWQDVLHEGPVPGGVSHEELRAVRADFLAERGWASFEATYGLFAARDRAVAGVGESEEIVLWFESDLYDQLQLLQIVDRLGSRRASLADLGEPGRHALLQIAGRFEQRELLAPVQRDVARQCWRAFSSPDPATLEELAALPELPLPYLAAALRRLLEEYPWVGDGLSRSERNVLATVAAGAATLAEVTAGQAEREERPFLGDTVVADRVAGLARCRVPLLAQNGSTSLTPAGRAVLAGDADHVQLNGIDRWLGGVHLRGDGTPWRWDPDGARLRDVRAGKAVES